MKKLLVFLFLAGAAPAFALTPDQILRRQEMLLQQQERQRQEEMNRQESDGAERIRRAREADGALSDAEEAQDGGAGEKPGCSMLEGVEFAGNSIYSAARLEKLAAKRIGKCVTKASMAAVQRDVSALYIDSGYTLARVYFDLKKTRQTETGGIVLHLVVEEGKISAIDMRSAGTNLDRQAYFAFPTGSGDAFNIKDFEQGLDQMNRLQSNNATLDLRPADAAGTSNVVVANRRADKTTFFSAGLDNGGSSSTGRNVASFSVNQDNLFDASDNLYLKYSHDAMFETDERRSQSAYGSLSVPFGYWTFSGTLSYSDYKTTVDGMYSSFHTTGSTLAGTLAADRVAYRGKRFKSALGSALTLKDTQSYIRDVKSLVGSRTSSNVNIYWNNTLYTPLGTLILKPSYQRGLSWFGAKEDPPGLTASEPRLQYDMLGLYAYYNTKVWRTPLTYTLTADGQYAFSPLYGTDQMSVGGLHTVRGFKDNSIRGDVGCYARSDLRVGLGDVGLPTNELLYKTQIGAFYDYGWVKNKYAFPGDLYNSQSGSMAGAGLLLNYRGDALDWSLTYAKALRSPAYLQSRDAASAENHSLYWRVSFNF